MVRDGSSRTFDKEGNLIMLDGKPIERINAECGVQSAEEPIQMNDGEKKQPMESVSPAATEKPSRKSRERGE